MKYEQKHELLCDFFKFFRDNGEKNIGMSIEQFVDDFLKKKIYIAGKITGIENEAFKLFESAEKRLISEGYEVVNPMKLPHDHDKKHSSYMIECLNALRTCDEIFMLTNFIDSKGAKTELMEACNLKLDIRYQ